MTIAWSRKRTTADVPASVAVYAREGLALQALRERSLLTRQQVARALTVHMSTLYDWEMGYQQVPPVERARVVALCERVYATLKETGTIR